MFKTTILLIFFALFYNASAFRYALLVGHNHGGKQVNDLRYAERDAERFSELLIELGGFERGNVITVVHPDSAELQSQLEKLEKVLFSGNNPENNLFLFYYSGHADGTDLLLGNTRFSMEKLQSSIKSSPAGIKIAVFDACQSGAITAFKGGARDEPFFLENQQKVKGQVIIASSAANERAQESETLKSSIFSFHWLNGLRGSADLSLDKKVTLNEAYQYAYRKTVETSALTSGEIQHPVYKFSILGQGDIVMTDLEKGSGGITIGRDCSGKFLVLSENYLDVFADFYKEKGKESSIFLPPGTYTIVNAQGSEVGTYLFSLKENRTHRISNSMFIPNTLTESRIKGNGISGSPAQKETIVPLSRFGWGIGLGMALEPLPGGSGWGRDMLLGLTGSYYLNNNLNLFFDLYSLIQDRYIGADIGLDYIFQLEKGRIYAGAGPGLEQVIGERLPGKWDTGVLLTTHVGFSTDLNKRTQFQLNIPYSLLFAGGTNHRVGIELRFLFSGRYSDVGKLNY